MADDSTGSNWGLIGGLLGSLGLDYAWSSLSAKKSYKRQRKLMEDAPTLMMTGLKRAGLNPILAAGGIGGTGVQHAPTAAPVDASSRVLGAASSAREASLMRSALKLQEEQRLNIAASTEKVRAEQDEVKARTRRESFQWAIDQEYAARERSAALKQSIAITTGRNLESELLRARLPEAKAIAELYRLGGMELVIAEKGVAAAGELADILMKIGIGWATRGKGKVLRGPPGRPGPPGVPGRSSSSLPSEGYK